MRRTGQSFPKAIEELKRGNRISRKGWNGKGMYLYLQKGSVDYEKLTYDDVGILEWDGFQKVCYGINVDLFEKGDSGTVTRIPSIAMFTAQGCITSWAPSQHDMFAEDWEVEEVE